MRRLTRDLFDRHLQDLLRLGRRELSRRPRALAISKTFDAGSLITPVPGIDGSLADIDLRRDLVVAAARSAGYGARLRGIHRGLVPAIVPGTVPDTHQGAAATGLGAPLAALVRRSTNGAAEVVAS